MLIILLSASEEADEFSELASVEISSSMISSEIGSSDVDASVSVISDEVFSVVYASVLAALSRSYKLAQPKRRELGCER